jgi:hypothetical protein
LRLLLIMIYIIMLSLNLARGIRLIEKRNDFPFTNCSGVTLIPLLLSLSYNYFTRDFNFYIFC